jgi:hypothetical protein
MSSEEQRLALKTAILEWQKKYGIQEGDPILATLELWEIYLNTLKPQSASERIPSFEEFRSSLEQLGRLSKGFAKQAGEVIQEMRAVPKIKSDLNRFPMFALVFTALIALLAGITIGKFVL